MTQYQAARLKRAGRRCTVLVCHEQLRRVAPPCFTLALMQPTSRASMERAYPSTAVAAAMKLSRF